MVGHTAFVALLLKRDCSYVFPYSAYEARKIWVRHRTPRCGIFLLSTIICHAVSLGRFLMAKGSLWAQLPGQ